VRYRSAEAFDCAIVDHMRQLFITSGNHPSQIRLFIAIDRGLARLAAVDDQAFIDKSGVALDYRIGHQARTTKDLDIAMRGFSEASDGIRTVCTVALDDFFSASTENEPVAKKPIVERVSTYRWVLAVVLETSRLASLTVDIRIEESFCRHDVMQGPNLLRFDLAGSPGRPSESSGTTITLLKRSIRARAHTQTSVNLRVAKTSDMSYLSPTFFLIALCEPHRSSQAASHGQVRRSA
jgi:hypothetical protein